MKCCASSLRPRRCMSCASAKCGSGNSGANSSAFRKSGSAVTKSPRSYAARASWYSRLALSRRSASCRTPPSSAGSLGQAWTPAPCPNSCITVYQLTAARRRPRRGGAIVRGPRTELHGVLRELAFTDLDPTLNKSCGHCVATSARRPSATACPATARWREAGVAAASYTASAARSLLSSTSAPWLAVGCSASTRDSDGAPEWSKAAKSATLEAASSSTRCSGWVPSGWASSWECRAAQSRQARPEEAQEPSSGTAKTAV
eukprot:scaffold37273_cov56-Phaeocystis_antarctica.AAC.5